MTRRSSPWTILIMTFIVCVLGIGLMEYMRHQKNSAIEALEQQVKDADQKASALRNRENKLKQHAEFRDLVEPKLLNASEGQTHAQVLMAMVRAARASGVTLGEIRFGGDKNDQTAMAIQFTLTGSESQAYQFISLMEQGEPLAQIKDIQWGLAVQNGQDSPAGSVVLQVRIFGTK